MKPKQKNVFIDSEGDKWFERNHNDVCNKQRGINDPVISALADCLRSYDSPYSLKLLEIGCGEGKRLHWIADNFGLQCFGVEPSKRALALANTRKVKARRGTADILNFESGYFDFVIFGFCLYVCDRTDLFQIASEANRVLKPNAWVIINDFFSQNQITNEYHHVPGLFSYKMDYRRLFDWHPHYVCTAHVVRAHAGDSYTDDSNNWVATSVLRKVNFRD